MDKLGVALVYLGNIEAKKKNYSERELVHSAATR